MIASQKVFHQIGREEQIVLDDKNRLVVVFWVRTEDEGVRLLRAVPPGAALAILDPLGKDYSSEDLAALIRDWRENGYRAAAFVIGGADGHAAAIRQKAFRTISFGRATWPHMLCRAMLAEQLYRASMILARHPYHRSN